MGIKKNRFKKEKERFDQILEYTFNLEGNKEKNELLLGGNSLNEADEEPEIPQDLGDSNNPDTVNQINQPVSDDDLSVMNNNDLNPNVNIVGDEFNTEGGEVELDITDLVNKIDDISDVINSNSSKIEQLISQYNELQQKINEFDKISSKLNDIKTEIIERNPTEVEKLEMRSLDSFPYNMKLTDFWDKKESDGNIIAQDKPLNQNKQTEYELTIDDIKQDYNPSFIKKTFNLKT